MRRCPGRRCELAATGPDRIVAKAQAYLLDASKAWKGLLISAVHVCAIVSNFREVYQGSASTDWSTAANLQILPEPGSPLN